MDRNVCDVDWQQYMPTMYKMFLTFDPVILLMRVDSILKKLSRNAAKDVSRKKI